MSFGKSNRAIVALGLALILAGCAATDPAPRTSTDTTASTTSVASTTTSQSPVGSTATAATPDGAVAVSGKLSQSTAAPGIFLVELWARNQGTATMYLPDQRSVCGRAPWIGTMTGPDGKSVVYRDPASGPGCDGWTSHQLAQGETWTWTADPTCHVRVLCDNTWDARIWTDGTAQAAPAGTYTWRLSLPVCTQTSPGQPEYTCPGNLHYAILSFQVQAPGNALANPPTDGVEVSGAVRPTSDGKGHLADVRAHNTSPNTYGIGQNYCLGSPWFAKLLGPNGKEVRYRDPNDNRLGCPGFRDGLLKPNQWSNWTANTPCTTYNVCDNVWDGRIWDESGQSQDAPPGTYTWRFWFPYYKTPGTFDDATGTFTGPTDYRAKQLEFTVNVP